LYQFHPRTGQFLKFPEKAIYFREKVPQDAVSGSTFAAKTGSGILVKNQEYQQPVNPCPQDEQHVEDRCQPKMNVSFRWKRHPADGL